MSEIFTVGALDQLAARDQGGFVHERRRLLADFMRESNASIELLADMQQTIDQTIAVSGTPMHALDHLASLIESNLLIIARLSRELAVEVKNHEKKKEQVATTVFR